MVPAVLTLDPLESPSLGGVMSIGRFARLAGLSIGALRHYAEIGLLRPARVDPRNILEAIDDFGVTNLFGSPALVNRVGQYGAGRGVKLPSLLWASRARSWSQVLLMNTWCVSDASCLSERGANTVTDAVSS